MDVSHNLILNSELCPEVCPARTHTQTNKQIALNSRALSSYIMSLSVIVDSNLILERLY